MAAAPSAMAPLIPGATPSGAAPSQPGSPDISQGAPAPAGGQTICITDNGDGTYSVGPDSDDSPDQGAGDSDDAQQQTVHGLKQALALAGQMLSGGADPKAAWNDEASKRDASGMPTPGAGTAPPSMSM